MFETANNFRIHTINEQLDFIINEMYSLNKKILILKSRISYLYVSALMIIEKVKM